MDKGEFEKALRISAVIPAYNAGKYIARSIDSVLNQTCPVDEIIVVDDGSTDNTADAVKHYGEKIRYIYQDNAGASAARNAGIQAATGDWIAFLDGDDEWLPDKIQLQTDLLARNPDLVWVTSNFITCSCYEKRQAARINPDKTRKLLSSKDYVKNYFQGYLAGLGGHTDVMTIRRDVLLEAGLFRPGQRKANDLDCWWRIAYRHPRMGYVSEPGAIYHLTIPQSISKKKTGWEHYADLIHRHLVLSRDYDQEEEFSFFAGKLLIGWMRSMLFGAQGDDIRQLLREFRDLIPLRYRCLMYGLTVFPQLTRAMCLILSKIIRTLRLRRQVVPPPKI
jgi:glycosyltransferase involved in cell wall biosynthesis